MSTARYNKIYEGWILEYTDFRRVAQGKRGDKKKKIKDRAYPVLSKNKQRHKEMQMQAYAVELEKQTKGNGDTPKADVPILAVEYLSGVKKFCRSIHPRTVEGARAIVARFRDFLKMQYADYYLHEINSEVALSYFRSISDYAFSTLIKHKTTLNYVFSKVLRKMQDAGSNLRYKNPFSDDEMLNEFALDNNGDNRGKVCKRSFSIEQIREIVAGAEMEKYPLFSKVWYIGYLTGWRLGDILALRWEQIDFANRMITMTHHKTKRFKIITKIFIIDRLLNILRTMRRSAKSDDEFLFPSWSTPKYGGLKFNRLSREKLSRMRLWQTKKSGVRQQSLYTFHGLRGTIITVLKLQDYNQDRIDYLVGHRGRGVDPTYYNRFYEHPEEATRDLLEYLDELLYPPQAVTK